ncbi:MAG: hypothetical protein ACE5OZ_26330, partial [Candidatus Heimdallarchaeota archaeon]
MSDRALSLEQRLDAIEEKLDGLISQVSHVIEIVQEVFPDVSIGDSNDNAPRPFDGLDFARLPKHLRQTLRCLQSKGQATASEVAKETRKERAVESDYLNQLHIM